MAFSGAEPMTHAHDGKRDGVVDTARDALGQGRVTKPTVRHYQGFARGEDEAARRALPDREAPALRLPCLVHRHSSTGIHLLRTGEVIANINALNARFRFNEIDELVVRKRSGAEKMPLDEHDLNIHRRLLNRLEARLQEAHDASHLPDEPTTVSALQDFVVRLRLNAAATKCP